MKTFFLILFIVGVAWNLRAYHNIEQQRADALKQESPTLKQVSPAVDSTLAPTEAGNGPGSEDGTIVIPWTLLEQTQYSPGEKPQFPAALKALEGRQVTVTGAVFSIKALEKDGKTKGALLMPLTKINCCGTACSNDPRTMLFVSCAKNPMPLPQAKVAATVTGRLSLSGDDAAWGLFTLEDANAQPYQSVVGAHP